MCYGRIAELRGFLLVYFYSQWVKTFWYGVAYKEIHGSSKLSVGMCLRISINDAAETAKALSEYFNDRLVNRLGVRATMKCGRWC